MVDEKNWIVKAVTEVKEVHCLPLEDLHEHQISAECTCNPEIVDPTEAGAPVWMHNAWDRRELYSYLRTKGINIHK